MNNRQLIYKIKACEENENNINDLNQTGEDGAAGRETLLSPMRSSHKKGFQKSHNFQNSTKSMNLQEDIAHVELKSVSSSQSVFTRSIFVRFHDIELRFWSIYDEPFLSDPGVPGVRSMGPDVSHSLHPRACADLIVVTLADEDSNSTLADYVNRAILCNVAMQVVPPGGKNWN